MRIVKSTEIMLYSPFSDCFGPKRNSVWFQINRESVITIQIKTKLFAFVTEMKQKHIVANLVQIKQEQLELKQTGKSVIAKLNLMHTGGICFPMYISLYIYFYIPIYLYVHISIFRYSDI